MLVVALKPNRRCRLLLPDGTKIWITMVECTSGKARVGISAPRNIQVLREELLPETERFNVPVSA